MLTGNGQADTRQACERWTLRIIAGRDEVYDWINITAQCLEPKWPWDGHFLQHYTDVVLYYYTEIQVLYYLL